MSENSKEKIKHLFHEAGFVLVGFLNQDDCELDNWIEEWLDLGYQGEMKWMNKYQSIRLAPHTIEPFGNTIIIGAYPYHTKAPAGWTDRRPISNYAWGKDYHVVLRKKLKEILSQMKVYFPKIESRLFVDTAPIPEKILAYLSGLGWIGKNGMLINRKLGSYLFLAGIVSSLDLSSDKPGKDYCGTCVKCIDACPTAAIKDNRMIDSRKCISYLTIEKRGAFSKTEKDMVEYQVFGCDICQQICPWNKKAPYHHVPEFECDSKWIRFFKNNPESTKQTVFNQLKINSPIKRTKLEGFNRNLKVTAKKRNKNNREE